MCTFDGARFVGEQLRSIVAQQPPPDEVVVSDDGSQDGTLHVVDEVASSTAVPIRVLRDQPRLGIVGNVERALQAASADVVFFADQDDVWLPGKLARQLAAMTSADAAFSDAFIVDGNGAGTGRRHWDLLGFDGRAQARFATDPLGVLLRSNPVCGAAFAVRRESVAPLLAGMSRHGLHDQWLALLLVATGQKVVPVAEPLIDYRVHGANQVGAPTAGVFRRVGARRRDGTRGDELRFFEDAHERLVELGAPPAVLARVDAKIAHLAHRASLTRHRARRLVPCVAELARGRYSAYSRGFESFAFDVLVRPARDRSSTWDRS